ncbi:MAG: cyclic nucleotide-binding domain-containing protein, partial [Gammaproteobacteria bacterium]
YILNPSALGKRGQTVFALRASTLLHIKESQFIEAVEGNPRLSMLFADRVRQQLDQNTAAQKNPFALSDLENLGIRPEITTYQKDEVIFNEGEVADAAFLVLSGAVRLSRQGSDSETLPTIAAGQVFGERGVLTGDARSATARAERQTRVIRLTADEFKRGYQKSNLFRSFIDAVDDNFRLPGLHRSLTFQGRHGDALAIHRLYLLADERSLLSTSVPDLACFEAFVLPHGLTEEEKPDKEIKWVEAESTGDWQCLRSISLDSSGALIRFSSVGGSSDASYVIELLTHHTTLDQAQLEEFAKTGRLRRKESDSQQPDDSFIVCRCANVSMADLNRLKGEGASDVRELQEISGCGYVCGGCLPTLHTIFGTSRNISVVPDSHKTTEDCYRVTLTAEAPLPFEWEAGQFIALSGRIDGRWISRNYTITSHPHKYQIELFVKREPKGAFSRWLLDGNHRLKELTVSSPHGNVTWAPESPSTTFFVAGIGLTPAIATARRLVNAEKNGSQGMSPITIDLSLRTKADLAAAEPLLSLEKESKLITLRVRFTKDEGRITPAEIRAIAEKHRTGQFVVCGPSAFNKLISDTLLGAGLRQDQVLCEDFVAPVTGDKALEQLRSAQSGVKKKRIASYLIGLGVLILSVGSLSLPSNQSLLPSGPANVGHESLKCDHCHSAAPGSHRQQLQAKAKFLLGYRQSAPDWGYISVSNDTCGLCHENPTDHHPTHVFLDPKFNSQQDLFGPHLCVSCHQEHTGRRVNNVPITFCRHCHEDLTLENDPLKPPQSPSHAELAQSGEWSTCLGCHSYHGNYHRTTPDVFAERIPEDRIRMHFRGKLPAYGEYKRYRAH